MIELQKYSRIDEEQLLKRVTPKHQDSRLKVIGYVSVALIVSLSFITYQIGRSVMMSAEERALKVFDSDADTEIMKAYVNFISEMGRSYKDRAETAQRYRNFKQNYITVQKSKEHEFHMPHKITFNNQFADLSAEEFLSKVAGGAVVPEGVMSQVSADGSSVFSARQETVPILDKVSEVPATKNWFEEGFIGSPFNQFAGEACASSWAFSTVSTLQAGAAINGGQGMTELSVQQLIDCDTSNNGCQGGWSSKGYAYTSKFGLMPKSDYAYTGVQGKCAFDESKMAVKNTGMVQERYVSNERLMSIVAKQPVSAGIVVTENFQLYGSGILMEDSLRCSDSRRVINHQVTIAGYGKSDPKTIEGSWCSQYWLVLNSWGTSWGEQGFFKLCMDGAGKTKTPYGTCQINRFPTFATFE